MTVAIILATLVFTGAIQIWMVVTLSFISGCGQAFGGPAYQSLIPTLVGKEHLPNAVALNSIQFNLARVIGPIVAGVALASFGMVACFGLNGISFLFVIAAILSLRDVHVPPTATGSMVDQMKGGLRYVRDSRNLKAVTLLGFIGAFLGLPLLTFLPVIVKDVFHAGRRFLFAADDLFRRRRGDRRADRRLHRQASPHRQADADLPRAVRRGDGRRSRCRRRRR